MAGAIGPSGMLPSSDDPALSGISFNQLSEAFRLQARGLIDGGADLLVIETQQDILETRAAVDGCRAAFADAGRSVPLQVQAALDVTGRMLLGTDIAAVLAILPFTSDQGPELSALAVGMSQALSARLGGIERLRDSVTLVAPSELTSRKVDDPAGAIKLARPVFPAGWPVSSARPAEPARSEAAAGRAAGKICCSLLADSARPRVLRRSPPDGPIAPHAP